ncbi:Asp23/Gls24 family envelope stress response protein [Kitasatospora sp. NPDC050543]|uniref:Asp23/Gls24 family envelope stress response protein n=1 Tax=Kitasatospora sp. NPDC050543 TaxID=3364054 RepID=UPI00379B360D
MAAVTAGGAAPRSAAGRGRLRIADRVFARIAARAAREAMARAWAGRAGRGAPPKVAISAQGSTATVRVSLELPYPCDLAAVAGEVRDRITERVSTLTGTRVGEVAVVVERLVPAGGRP